MRVKTLPIILPPGMYEQLEREARAEERDAVQHARWILKRHLETPATKSATGISRLHPASDVPVDHEPTAESERREPASSAR